MSDDKREAAAKRWHEYIRGMPFPRSHTGHDDLMAAWDEGRAEGQREGEARATAAAVAWLDSVDAPYPWRARRVEEGAHMKGHPNALAGMLAAAEARGREEGARSRDAEVAELRSQVDSLRRRTHEIAEAKDAEHAERHREMGRIKARFDLARQYADETLRADWEHALSNLWWPSTSEHNRLVLTGLVDRLADREADCTELKRKVDDLLADLHDTRVRAERAEAECERMRAALVEAKKWASFYGRKLIDQALAAPSPEPPNAEPVHVVHHVTCPVHEDTAAEAARAERLKVADELAPLAQAARDAVTHNVDPDHAMWIPIAEAFEALDYYVDSLRAGQPLTEPTGGTEPEGGDHAG